MQINSYIQYKLFRGLTHYPMQQFPSASRFDFCFEIILDDDHMWSLDECPDCPLGPCDNILAVSTFQKHKVRLPMLVASSNVKQIEIFLRGYINSL